MTHDVHVPSVVVTRKISVAPIVTNARLILSALFRSASMTVILLAAPPSSPVPPSDCTGTDMCFARASTCALDASRVAP